MIPNWLIKTLIEFNHRTTSINEWELTDMAVDLHRQPDLPERLDVLFNSLKDGLGEGVLLAGNFIALGYYVDIFRGGKVEKTKVFPRFVELGKNAIEMRELRRDDDEVAIHAFDHTAKSCEDASNATDSCVLIQIPYFIRRSEDYVADEFEEIKYEDFQQKLDQNKILFTQIQRVTSQEEVRSWINQHTSEHYEQRFILTLGLRSHQDITDNIKDPSTEHALAQLLGSFLTWAGMAVGDSNHPTMAAAVSRLAHYSHEFLKPFAELRLFLEDNPAAVPTELQNILDKVLNKVELLDLSELADEIQIQRSPGNWPRLREILRLALVNNTTFEKEELAEGSYTPALKIDSPKERKVCIDLKGLPDDSVSVDFDASYFQALIRNLLRNTIQHSSEEQPRIVLSFERQNGFCVMRFKHVGSRISRKIRKQLFRMPMSTRAASADRPFTVSRSGIGLWTVGMAFEAQRLPLPKVTQDDDGVCFSFWFRVANV